jgi:hypothetical protein
MCSQTSYGYRESFGRNVERVSKFSCDIQCRVSYTAFNHSDIGRMKPGAFSEAFL